MNPVQVKLNKHNKHEATKIFKNPLCKKYEECLNYVVFKTNWKYFSCNKCELKNNKELKIELVHIHDILCDEEYEIKLRNKHNKKLSKYEIEL